MYNVLTCQTIYWFVRPWDTQTHTQTTQNTIEDSEVQEKSSLTYNVNSKKFEKKSIGGNYIENRKKWTYH